MNKARMDVPQAKIAAFCRKWKITELSLFGSVLRDDFRADSDVDVLVSFAPDSRWSLMDLVRMEEELGGILGRKVDMVERKSVELSENYIRRSHILDSLEPCFSACCSIICKPRADA
jgi:predicted nucleotidyltransferase